MSEPLPSAKAMLPNESRWQLHHTNLATMLQRITAGGRATPHRRLPLPHPHAPSSQPAEAADATSAELLDVWQRVAQLVAAGDPLAFPHCSRSFCFCHEARPLVFPT
eukprot:CAMPEP_0181195522 /NCGR_PEP_ID=MMETSP1096-20121128/14936_1 /TAXON_ID=156174 ORGANISM="Chrysochromulina ericina, Strain CCMP281" /NCGR_SAMPLE_ID=MMETSP1096 /ASSEMBLY_ACC=CAM_ASM_000453 /LENGTH=106 /DNA_ID=CAMNT_0023285139 /DNA_START=89 /DNA_END=410 /DNA_ORIENTATION=-